MDTEILLLLGGVILLLVCSAFFSGSETALMSLSKPKLHKQEKDGHKGAKRVNKVVSDTERLLGTILLGNNLVNIAASALTTGLFIKLFGDSGIAVATLVMTFIILIFAEILPKTIASRKPEKHAMWISVPMQGIIFILKPFTAFIASISRGIMKLFGINLDESITEFDQEDVRGAIGMGLKEGVLEKGEHRMLDSILELDEITVDELMIHRSSIESLDINSSMEDLYKHIAERPVHSRLPVWKDSRDNVVGILLVKDFNKAYFQSTHSNVEFKLEDIIQAPYFIPETATVRKQLLEFRKKRSHMALVVDEYGDIQGLLTLEDILEEIVGEIEDEHDIIKSDFIKHKDGNITISGDFAVRDANRKFGWKLDDEDAVTIGGLIIDELERIPVVGESVKVDNLLFKVISKKRQAISKVKVSKVTKSSDDTKK